MEWSRSVFLSEEKEIQLHSGAADLECSRQRVSRTTGKGCGADREKGVVL